MPERREKGGDYYGALRQIKCGKSEEKKGPGGVERACGLRVCARACVRGRARVCAREGEKRKSVKKSWPFIMRTAVLAV
jgi:hypothetical protein